MTVTTVSTGKNGTYHVTAMFIVQAVVEKMQANGFDIAIPTGGEAGDAISINFDGRVMSEDTPPEKFGVLTLNDDTDAS